MNKIIPPQPSALIRLVLGLSLALCVSAQANQLASPGGVLPPLPEGTDTDNRAGTDLDRAAIEQVSRDLAAATGKPRVAVMEALITIDGVPRPDLGASFSDALTAKLLNAGDYDLVDASALPSQSLNTAGAQSAYDFGKISGADYVIVPTVISTQGEFRLSIRKLKLPGGKIEKIVQQAGRGDHRAIFDLAEKISVQLAPALPAQDPSKQAVGYSYVRTWMAPTPPPAKVDPILAAVKKAPKALKGNGSLASAVAQNKVAQTYAQTPQRLGSIISVDTQWCFCEFQSPVGSVKLKDPVFAWSGSTEQEPVALKVSRIEGSRVIAEYDPSAIRKNSLFPGLSIYQWK